MLNLAKQMCAEYEVQFEPATCNESPADESSEVANTVDTLVDTIEMTHAEVAVEQPDKSALYNAWQRFFLQNKIANGMSKLAILFRFAKKVVQYRRQRIQQELALWRERMNVANEQFQLHLQNNIANGMKKMRILFRFVKKVVQIRRGRIHQEQVLFRFTKKVVKIHRRRIRQKQILVRVAERVSHYVVTKYFDRFAQNYFAKTQKVIDTAVEISHCAQLQAHKLAQDAQDAVDSQKEIIRKAQELALCQALDNAIEIPHRAQLHAHKFAQQAEDAVNAMLENLGEEQMNEEIDDVAVANDSSDECEDEPVVESAGDISQRIANKITELKNIFVQNESTLNHKHGDLTKTNVRDCLKMISKDYEKKLKSLNPNNYKYEHIVVCELKQLEYKVDHEIKDMLANVEHFKASQISHAMHHTPEPDWLHTIEEDGVAYYTQGSGE
jgi:hypothetical protein